MATSLTGFTSGWNCANISDARLTACGWPGITCTNIEDQDYVTAINLANPGFSLAGTLPGQVFTLPFLTIFNLVGHSLNSPLPSGMTDSPAIERLIIQNCQLVGSIPADLGNIGTLSFLSLSNNVNLTGVIPPSIGLPTYLSQIDLSNTGISGTLPADLNILLLSTLRVQQTKLSAGCFPQKLATLPILGTCDTSSTSFFCDCDAPSHCNAKQCCANVAGLSDAGLVCEAGGWTSANLSVPQLTVDVQTRFGFDTVVIKGDLSIERNLAVLRGNLEITGSLTLADEATLVMQANTSIKVGQRFSIGNASFRILTRPTDVSNLLWKPVTAGSISATFDSTEIMDSKCFLHTVTLASTLISVNFTAQPCPTELTTSQILAMIFAPLCITVVAIFFILVYTRPEFNAIVNPVQDEAQVQMLQKGPETVNRENP